MAKLTKTTIDKIDATDRDQWVWCDELPGFGIRVQPGGRKTYVIRYRTIDATQRKMTIARCTDMPPERARDLARKKFAMVAEGLDPIETKLEGKNAPTLAEVKDRYMKEHAIPFKKPRSVQVDETNWRLYILPALGKKKVAKIDLEDVLTLIGSLSTKPATANQCLALLSKTMNLCEIWKYRPRNSNPCKGAKKFKIKERETILSQDEIGRLNTVLNDMITSNEIRKPMGDLVRLLLLTGCRLNEIMSSERKWVDETRKLLLLPDSKVGERKIPLSPWATEIIGGISKDQKWLIPGRVKANHMTAPYQHWKAIKERAKLPTSLRIHDLRHTAGSLAHASGLSQKQVALLLGHRQLSTTARYLHGQTGEGVTIAGALEKAVTQKWADIEKHEELEGTSY